MIKLESFSSRKIWAYTQLLKGYKSVAHKTRREELIKDLPVREVLCDLPDKEKFCGQCGTPLKPLGKETVRCTGHVPEICEFGSSLPPGKRMGTARYLIKPRNDGELDHPLR